MKLKYINLYRNILEEYEDLSTCSRLHVAALLVKQGVVLSVGYNGVAAGKTHCNEIFTVDADGQHVINDLCTRCANHVTAEAWYDAHHEFSERNEIHAEVNCLMSALKNNVNIDGCSLLVSYSPCINCAKMIVASGIKNVIFTKIYDRSDEGLKYLKENGVNVIELNEAEHADIQ